MAVGPLTAAIPISGSPAIRSASTAASARTASIPPPAGSSCISRPRAETSRAACSSGSASASTAAAYSPMLWPSSIPGRTPSSVRVAASA